MKEGSSTQKEREKQPSKEGGEGGQHHAKRRREHATHPKKEATQQKQLHQKEEKKGSTLHVGSGVCVDGLGRGVGVLVGCECGVGLWVCVGVRFLFFLQKKKGRDLGPRDPQNSIFS